MQSEEDIRIDCENITDDELEEWVITSAKVLTVMKDGDQSVYKHVYQDFLLDLQNLKNSGRITSDDYDNILENV